MQKLKTNLFRTLRSKVLPLKPGVDQNIAMHASPTARDFFLANFYLSNALTFIIFQNLSHIFPVLDVANAGPCVGPQNEIGHPARHHRKLVQVPESSAAEWK